jgi:hypothetical protein
MPYRVPVGNGKYCYTRDCSLHSAKWTAKRRDTLQVAIGGEATKSAAAPKKTPLTHPAQWKKGLQVAEAYVLRDERPEYMAAIDEKHFNALGHGSKFTDERVGKIEDVLSLAVAQRGNLDGDDRDELQRLGAPSGAFIDQCRYIKVRVDGVEALQATDALPEDEILTIKGKGKGADGRPKSLSVVARVEKLSAVKYATVIIGPREDEKGGPIEGEMLWTMFPGVATQSPRSDKLREAGLEDGDKITVRKLRSLFGDFKVNAELG